MIPNQFRIDPKDPDAALVAVFKNHAVPNEAMSAKEGRLICDDVEICEIRFPGSRAVSVFPALALTTEQLVDPYTGARTRRTYAERFARQYQQFKAHTAQTKAGTPLEYVPFLTEAKRAELRALNIYTLEALAAIEGAELKNLGHGGRECKNKAMEFMDDARRNVPSTTMLAELEAMKAKNQALEDDNATLKLAAVAAAAEEERCGDESFDAMTDNQLKDYIAAATGARPMGNPGRRSLLRMAMGRRERAEVE